MNRLAIYASLLVPVVAVVTAGWNAHEPAIPPGFGASGPERQDWSAYGGAPENNHNSALAQINRSNVKRLAVACSFDTEEDGVLQSSPIIIAGVLYGFTPTQKVLALDAAVEKPMPGFGTEGNIDHRENLGRGPATSQAIVLTSPGIVYKELVIVGGRYPETLPAPPGDIRAFDVRTGRLRWSFHTIPHP